MGGGRKNRNIKDQNLRVKKSVGNKRRHENDFVPNFDLGNPPDNAPQFAPEDGLDKQNDDVCAKCKQGKLQENSIWVQCDTCDDWYHLDCSGLPPDVDIDSV